VFNFPESLYLLTFIKYSYKDFGKTLAKSAEIGIIMMVVPILWGM